MTDSFNPLEHIDSYVEAMPWTLEALNDYIEPIYSEFYSFVLREFVFAIPTLSKLEIEFLAKSFNKQSTHDKQLGMSDLGEIFNDFMDPIWLPNEVMSVEGTIDGNGLEKKETRRNFLSEYAGWRAFEETLVDISDEDLSLLASCSW